MERITRFRAITLLVVFALLLSFFSVRMYGLQINDTGDVVRNSDTYTSYYVVKADRGDLLDRNGNVMVGNRASYNLVFNNFVLMSSTSPNESLLRLVKLCQEQGIEYIEHFPITQSRPYEYTHDQYSSGWYGYFQAYLTNMEIDSDISAPQLIRKLRDRCRIPSEWSDEEARLVLGLRYELALRTEITNLPSYVFIEDVSDDALNAIMELNIPGLDTEVSTVREYHTKYLAHVLGSMTKISAEDWPEYKEKGYSMDAYVGADGLEKAFEDYLHGTDGLLKRVVDSEGNVISETYVKLPKAGNNVEITVDLDLQAAAEDALAYAIENMRATGGANEGTGTGADAEGGAVVAVEVDTGRVLACASYPTYDLTRFREQEYFDQLNNDPVAPFFNRALMGTYPPGSTFKMCTAIAGMENGAISRYSTIVTKGIYTKYDGLSPACLVYSRHRAVHGTINVSQALSVSCNYFFYEVGDRLTNEQLDTTAKLLGLGEPTGIEVDERIGRRANPETKAALYEGVGATWNPGDQILAAIGQSENRFTPMQLASYTATVANGGTRYACTFLNRIVSSDYSTLVEEKQPEVLSVVPMSEDTKEAIAEGMKDTCKTGTAYAYFQNYSTVEVAAKTGTAEHGSGGSNHGSFACFAPADDPQIAIYVYGEKVGTGGYMSTVAQAIMDVYFSRDESSEVVTYENRVG